MRPSHKIRWVPAVAIAREMRNHTRRYGAQEPFLYIRALRMIVTRHAMGLMVFSNFPNGAGTR